MGVLRMLLAFAVLSHHGAVTAGELLPGSVSVRLFFIISGFYMALILDGKYGPGSLRTFYGNRVLRLWPTYLAVALVSLGLLLFLDLHPFSCQARLGVVASHPGGVFALVVPNLLILGQEALYLLGVGSDGGLFWAAGLAWPTKAFTLALVPQAWSVSVELCFYALAPFLARLGTRTLVVAGFCSLVLYAGMWASGPAGGAVAYRFLPSQLYLFVAGMLAYRMLGRLEGAGWMRRAGWVLVPGLPLMLVLIGTVPGPWLFPVAAVVVWAGLPPLFAATRHCRWDRALGHFSYPFYMVQFVMITLYEEYLGETDGLVLLLMVAAGAAALWLLVDRPLDRVRQRRAGAAVLHLPGGGGSVPAPVLAGPVAVAPVGRVVE